MLVIEGGRWLHAISEISGGNPGNFITVTFCKQTLIGKIDENMPNCGDCLAEAERRKVRIT